MIVYCDTSFLVSFLNESDVNHRTARETDRRAAGNGVSQNVDGLSFSWH
jgi:predicted nucleic acid-binding protein